MRHFITTRKRTFLLFIATAACQIFIGKAQSSLALQLKRNINPQSSDKEIREATQEHNLIESVEKIHLPSTIEEVLPSEEAPPSSAAQTSIDAGHEIKHGEEEEFEVIQGLVPEKVRRFRQEQLAVIEGRENAQKTGQVWIAEKAGKVVLLLGTVHTVLDPDVNGAVLAAIGSDILEKKVAARVTDEHGKEVVKVDKIWTEILSSKFSPPVIDSIKMKIGNEELLSEFKIGSELDDWIRLFLAGQPNLGISTSNTRLKRLDSSWDRFVIHINFITYQLKQLPMFIAMLYTFVYLVTAMVYVLGFGAMSGNYLAERPCELLVFGFALYWWVSVFGCRIIDFLPQTSFTGREKEDMRRKAESYISTFRKSMSDAHGSVLNTVGSHELESAGPAIQNVPLDLGNSSRKFGGLHPFLLLSAGHHIGLRPNCATTDRSPDTDICRCAQRNKDWVLEKIGKEKVEIVIAGCAHFDETDPNSVTNLLKDQGWVVERKDVVDAIVSLLVKESVSKVDETVTLKHHDEQEIVLHKKMRRKVLEDVRTATDRLLSPTKPDLINTSTHVRKLLLLSCPNDLLFEGAINAFILFFRSIVLAASPTKQLAKRANIGILVHLFMMALTCCYMLWIFVWNFERLTGNPHHWVA